MTDGLRRILLLTTLAIALIGGEVSRSIHLLNGTPVEAASVSVPSETVPSVQTVDGDNDHHGMWGDWDDWRWWAAMPVMLLFWVGVIWLIVWLVRQSSQRPERGGDDPMEIARRRYARGEISRDEFEQIRRDLSD